MLNFTEFEGSLMMRVSPIYRICLRCVLSVQSPRDCILRVAESIGRGYTSIRHAGNIGDIYDSDLLRILASKTFVWTYQYKPN